MSNFSDKTFFFCGVGGSGMLPLAVYLKKKGARIIGSDRSYDNGQMGEKFEALKAIGIELVAQDGNAVTDAADMLVVSSAVEEKIPDVRKAVEIGLLIIKRGALLAELFNSSEKRIAVAGTSGKSTVTGMIGTLLLGCGADPSVVNGGEILNFRTSKDDRFSGVRYGRDPIFIAEMDESDGSIAHYTPDIAVLNNIALDHMSMEELVQLFGDYLSVTKTCAVVNYDQPRVKELVSSKGLTNILSYGIDNKDADLVASGVSPRVDGISFSVGFKGETVDVSLHVPGRHNVENALSAIGAGLAAGYSLKDCAQGLSGFKGIHRRMEFIGQAGGVTVYDDFGHNPDKISASLETLKMFDGRLIVMFQPHGFGPLRLMGNEIVQAFAEHLSSDDVLIMPEVYYAGGTVDRSVTAHTIIERVKGKNINAYWFETRDEILPFLSDLCERGDRVVIMGARDDSLHVFAHDVLDLFSEQ